MNIDSESSFYMINKKLSFFLLISIFFINTASANAASTDVDIQLYMATELGNYPPYCQHRLADVRFRDQFTDNKGSIIWPPNFSASRNRWINYIGHNNYVHLHHYCGGIKKFNQYSSLSYNQKKNNKEILKGALEEFEYMRTRADLYSFPLWYNLYTFEALIYTDLGDHAKASWALKQSQKYRNRR